MVQPSGVVSCAISEAKHVDHAVQLRCQEGLVSSCLGKFVDGLVEKMSVGNGGDYLYASASIQLDGVSDICRISQPAHFEDMMACGVWNGLTLAG